MKEVIDPHLVYHALEPSLLVILSVCEDGGVGWGGAAGYDLCCLRRADDDASVRESPETLKPLFYKQAG